MKNGLFFFLLPVILLLAPLPAFGDSSDNALAKTYFRWVHPAKKIETFFPSAPLFRQDTGRNQVTGTENLGPYVKKISRFLADSEEILITKYGLTPSDFTMQIKLIPLSEIDGIDLDTIIQSQTPSTLTFPFPIDETRNENAILKSFSLFNLLHGLIKAHLVFGNDNRLPVSSHAYRFVDGLSGFLALELISEISGADQTELLHYLEVSHQKQAHARSYSSSQLLSQNSSSESTDMLAGLNQFFSGISLSRSPEQAMSLGDSSSTADRIRVFQWIQHEKSDRGIKKIIQYLSVNSDIWTIQESQEENFCNTYVGVGCRSQSIDGTRADIIITYVVGVNFAQLLKTVRSENPPTSTEFVGDVPAYPVYGFQYPKVGGANEGIINLSYQGNSALINSKDILENERIQQNGFHLGMGFRDEAYQIQVEITYTTGTRQRDDTFSYANTVYEAQQSLVYTNLLIGSRITESGAHSGWKEETGISFHWIRLQSEWDMSHLAVKKTDLEYINRGYYLLDIQNYRAITVADSIDVGLNLDFQIGLVNQSGSCSVARDEKYNKDFSNLILGATVGQEIRFQLKKIGLDARLGAEYNYLWQPMSDKGGKTGSSELIDASQSILSMFISIGWVF